MPDAGDVIGPYTLSHRLEGSHTRWRATGPEGDVVVKFAGWFDAPLNDLWRNDIAPRLPKLRIPSLVKVHKWVPTDEGVPSHLVFEAIELPSVRSHIARSGPFTAERAAYVARSVARVLSAMHPQGLFHNGVHSRKVHVAGTEVVLADFGQPEAFPDDQAPGWDLYALGLLLGEMLTGQLLDLPVTDDIADGKNRALRYTTMQQGPFPHLEAIENGPLREIVSRLTDLTRADTLNTAQQALEQLERLGYGAEQVWKVTSTTQRVEVFHDPVRMAFAVRYEGPDTVDVRVRLDAVPDTALPMFRLEGDPTGRFSTGEQRRFDVEVSPELDDAALRLVVEQAGTIVAQSADVIFDSQRLPSWQRRLLYILAAGVAIIGLVLLVSRFF